MFLIPSRRNMCGSILIVRPFSSFSCTTSVTDKQLQAIQTIYSKLTGLVDPYFYIPKSDFAKGVLEKIDPSTKKCYWLARLSVGGKTTDRVLSFDPSGPLENLVRIEVSALGRFVPFHVRYFFLTTARCLVRRRREASWTSPERPIQTHRDDPIITRDQN